MTSGSLFFKLQREDLKRRVWAIALLLLAFFFAMPVNLALNMENAENTHYFRYNNYEPFIQDGSMPQQQYQERLLALKTMLVEDQAGFGNGLLVFLMLTAAVVIGVSSFSYLHNKRKVDFYHSIPVRRELLFGVQFADGILITGAAFLINACLLAGVSQAYGVPVSSIMGCISRSFGLNMLYYCLNYVVVTVAMMMTGNMIVGLLGTGVFFFFMPGLMLLLMGYCETFFITTPHSAWSSDGSLLLWGMKYLSPFSAYIMAVSQEFQKGEGYTLALINTVFVFCVLTVLSLELYRKRPSEAAGKAMAFKRSKAPIRIILVLGAGLAGGMFFWALQSSLKWGLFGMIAAVVLSHCIIEIIYHFDFKKLFSHWIQLSVCLAAGVLFFLSFRYDWYGYDSYMPGKEDIASVSVDIGEDSDWVWGNPAVQEGQRGSLSFEYPVRYKRLEQEMRVTDVDTALILAEEGRRYVLEDREYRLGKEREETYAEGEAALLDPDSASSVSVIGGADGPTSVFVAGKLSEKYYTQMTITYQMKNGRSVSRSYYFYLSEVMDAYRKLYENEEYKNGLYYILNETPEKYALARYEEGTCSSMVQDGADLGRLFDAYKKDLAALTLDQRIEESPAGSLNFVSREVYDYVNQRKEALLSYYGSRKSHSDAAVEYMLDNTQSWPVYPSFTNTIEVLKSLGIELGSSFRAEHVKRIEVNVWNSRYNGEGNGTLMFDGEEEIRLLMEHMVESEMWQLDGFKDALPVSNVEIFMDDGSTMQGVLVEDNMTPEVLQLFAGISFE